MTHLPEILGRYILSFTFQFNRELSTAKISNIQNVLFNKLHAIGVLLVIIKCEKSIWITVDSQSSEIVSLYNINSRRKAVFLRGLLGDFRSSSENLSNQKFNSLDPISSYSGFGKPRCALPQLLQLQRLHVRWEENGISARME